MNGSLILILSLFIIVCFWSQSNAEDGYCSDAEVLSTSSEVEGPKDSPVNLVLIKNNRTDCGNWPQGEAIWFRLNKGNSNGMLATVLAAKVAEYSVTITTESGNSYSSDDTLVQVGVDNPL